MVSPDAPHEADGPASERATHTSVHRTVAAIAEAAQAAGMTVFATVDHAAGARDVGLELPDEVVIFIGAPKVGTALMQADPRAGLDLPLRLLVWDDDGIIRVAWRDPRTLAAEYQLQGLDPTLAQMAAGVRKVLAAASGAG
jgi:uncharacterized protein (DUF302 family)